MAERNLKGDVNVEFAEASSRQGLDSGESVKTLFGKLRKWLSDLKPVAFSGSYSDLSNKPTIPTVNNGTLTIQKNGTNVATFTANQSGNSTANIAVPTKVSELTNDSGYIINTYESKLLWGGNNITSSFGPIDAAMINELGANRLCFIPGSAVTVEYSRDGGSTWTDYGANNATKTALFSNGSAFYIGKADSNNKATANTDKYQLRITIDTDAGNVYSVLNKFVFYISTNGSANCTVTLQKALQSSPTSFTTHASMSIGGWPGYNILNCDPFTTYGNTSASQYQYGRIRFIFKANGGNTNYIGLYVIKIMAFGGMGWITPSTMAKTGHLYSFDAYQNASFPATVTATSFNGDGSHLTNLNASNISSGTLAKERVGLDNVDNTSDANKPISTAAQAALDKQQAQIDYNTNQGVKNLVKITADTQTINGVTFTVDKVAGTVTANGTSTSQIAFKLTDYLSTSILQVGNTYILSGCPAGGNYTSTYALYVFNAGTSSTVWVDVGLSGGSSYVIPSDIRLSPLHILIRSGVTCNNLVFKPMIRDASIKDDTFEPHAESNCQLTQKVDKALEQTGYNLFEITADTQTINGVTFTVDKAAGTITANGTATAQAALVVGQQNIPFNYAYQYTISGLPSGSETTYFFNLETSQSKNYNIYIDQSLNLYKETYPSVITRASIYIRKGQTVSNLVFKPMIVPSELAGVPFQPYAMSNMELTQKALIKEDDNAGNYDITLDKPFTLRYGLCAISISNRGIELDQVGNIVSIKSDGIYFNGEKVGS